MNFEAAAKSTSIDTVKVKKERSTMKRMVRIGKWSAQPSKDAVKCINVFVADYFKAETVWTRKEHGAFVVAVRESATNTAAVEEFRFNREMSQRFRFTETASGDIEVELRPL
jgi:hypothetical protein